jgi:hypothetical protein
VDRCGAATGCILLGVGLSNQGLRLRILEEQAAGDGGPVRGDFVLLSTGDNIHADALRPLLGRVTDAAEVVRAARARHPGRVSPVNANILVPEPRAGEGVTDRAEVGAVPLGPRAAHADLCCGTCRREIPGSAAAGDTAGQVIVDLRVLHLSGIWAEVVRRDLQARPLPEPIRRVSYKPRTTRTLKKPA